MASATLFKSVEPPGTGPPNNPVFGQHLGSKTLEGSTRSYDFRMPFQIMFEQPLEVRRGEDYVILATLKVKFICTKLSTIYDGDLCVLISYKFCFLTRCYILRTWFLIIVLCCSAPKYCYTSYGSL